MPLDTPRKNEVSIGETRRTPRGYFLRVSRVFFTETHEGTRVRITLLRETTFCTSIDFTPGLVADLIDLLQEARRT
jgi:hypothetical protein